MRLRLPTKLPQKLVLLTAFALMLLIWWRNDWGCLIQRNTGIPCPGCGLSRAWLAAIRLDFAGAFSWHPMFWSVPVLALFLVYDAELFPSRKWNITILGLILAGWAVVYAARLVMYFSGAI